MNEFNDVARLFTRTVNNLKRNAISLNLPLEEFVIRKCGDDLAYIDNRREAKERYGFDFWKDMSAEWLVKQGIKKKVLYSNSWQFPDFLFKVKKHKGKLAGGSLLELKDSKSGQIASFNSTIPTKYKSLEEIDVINGNNLVSRIAKIKEGSVALDENYYKFERRCFYLIRTNKNDETKVKVSIVDASFFETVPKDHLFYQMFLNILQTHLEKKRIKIPRETLKKVEEALSHITDQTIVASSQLIDKASIKPRLRIMAEVHPEGNPHKYPEILEGTFNLIIQSLPQVKTLKEELCASVPEIEVFSIHHKRNGEHTVFQFAPK